MQRFYTVRQENQPVFSGLVNLRDETGHAALTAAHVQILEYVGSFTVKNGCWASDRNINDQTIRARSPKTIRRHLEYLLAVGALQVSKNDKGRVYRLGRTAGPIASQKRFRVAKGMPEYAYAQRKGQGKEAVVEKIDEAWFKEEPAPQKQALFLAKPADKFAAESAKLADEKANFAPILNSSTQTAVTKKEQTLPPKVPPRTLQVEDLDDFLSTPVAAATESSGSLRDPVGQPNSRLTQSDGLDGHREGKEDFQLNSKGDEWSQPLPGKKPPRKTERERIAEAAKRSAAGHIVNPNGTPDNRKKELNWKLARDIGPTGAVTVSQLWRHLVKLWDSSFGPGIIENMLSKDRSAMDSTFGELKQAFIQLCDFEPSNRDLAEYFDWFLEPKRLASILSGGKYANPNDPKSMLHFRQLCGSVFVVRFHKDVVSKREGCKKPVGETTKADRSISAIEEIFGRFRESCDKDLDFILAAIGNGYALAAQFLHEEKNMDESACKQRIIKAMKNFLVEQKDKKKALGYLKRGMANTEMYSSLLRKETCIWFEWKEKTEGLIDIALEQSGVNPDECAQ